MIVNTPRATRRLFILAAVATFWASAGFAQTQPGAGTRTQRPARPTPQKPAAKVAAKPAEPAPPPAPVARDLRFKTVYISGDRRTESVGYRKGARERFEFADMVVLRQRDLKTTVQISPAARSYLLVADGGPATPPAAPAASSAAATTPGVVIVTTKFVDTGERKTILGLQARHVRTTIDRQPLPGACDPAKQRIETDGWYVDVPAPAAAAVRDADPHTPAGCVDEIRATHEGDAKSLGFPVSYVMTMTGEDGKPNVTTMEVTELEVGTLDAALFEIPVGFTESRDLLGLSRAISDANERKLAHDVAAALPSAPKTPGVIRIAVPELINKTTQQVDTRALRARLIAELTEMKLEAEPLPAAPQEELLQRATQRGADFVLVAEVADLKASKGGGFGGLLKTVSTVAGAGPGKDPTEATVSIKLVQPDGKARIATNVKKKDGGFDLKAGLGVARLAGTMYMSMMTGRMMLHGFNASMAGNLQEMGMLGDPALFNMQAQGFGMGAGMGMRMGLDPTAGAASFLMQQAMAGDGSSGMPGQQAGPSFDAALSEALKNAAKVVSEHVGKTEASKKR